MYTSSFHPAFRLTIQTGNFDYPNNEVRRGFVTLTANSYFGKIEERPDNWVKNLDRMLRRCDLDSIRDAFTSFLASIPYEANTDERAKDFETHFSWRVSKTTHFS